MELKNKTAMLKTKLKLVELQEFKDLEPHEQVTVVSLLESGIEIYLEAIGDLMGNNARHKEYKLN